LDNNDAIRYKATFAKVPFVLALCFLNLGLIVGALILGGLFVAAFVHLYHAVHSGLIGSSEALHQAIEGVELLFLAPLPFLIIYGLLQYLTARIPNEDIGNPESSERLKAARAEMFYLKAFAVSLFISAIAASLVGKLLKEPGLTASETVAGVLVILTLGGYFFLLESLSDHARERHGDSRPDKGKQ
jgi:hypothetical protein